MAVIGEPRLCQCGGLYMPSAPVSRPPVRCPVCEGRGSMPHGFYSRSTAASSTEPETCKACLGRGIIV